MRLRVVHLFATLFLVLNCDNLIDDNVLTITSEDSGATYSMGREKRFNATFRECRGCADVWEIEEIDATKIKYIGKEYSNPSCRNCVGGSQDVTFKFISENLGSSDIVFSYFEDTVRITIGIWAED